ncbi:putative Phage tail tape measure protein domain-containing protein [Hyphomicrobium sp. 1Nfss2.1]|uniref:hypothetical protein n=1 Tax=Hyphomicrobium sp. 1Nfss2.1 TaxID=3413936 RepID=UPI003C7B3633
MADAVGAIRIDVAANVASIQAQLNQIQRSFDRFGAQLSATMKGLASTLALALGPAAIGAAVKHVINLADRIDDLSQSLGISAEQLSAWSYAAKLSGTDLEGLASGITKLNRSLGEIASGTINDAQRALNAMGVSAVDANGNLRSQGDIIEDVADRFSGYQDGATKAALAQALFGKSGADLIPFLNNGRIGLAALTREAERMGLIISTDTAKQASQLNDEIDKLKGYAEGAALALAGVLVPALNRAFEALNKELQEGGFWSLFSMDNSSYADATEGARAAMDAISRGVDGVTASLEASNVALGEWQTKITAGQAPVMQSLADINAELKRSAENMATYHAFIRDELSTTLSIDTTPYEERYAAIEAAVQSLAITQQQGARLTLQTKKQEGDAWLDLASNAGTALTTIFEDNKAAAAASAIINTLVGITKAFELPFPLNWAQASLVAATGFAQVAKIRSTSQGSSGGSSSIGSGGTAAVSSATSDTSSSSEAQSTSVYIKVEGDTFNRETVESLVEQLREYQLDGGQLIIQRD